jgi:hypothetical protein
MKKYLIFAICALSIGSSYGQDFVKGGNYVTLGYGFDPYYRPLGNFGIGPVVATYERGITDILGIGRIGAGGGVSAAFYPGTYSNGLTYTGSRFSIMGRGTYHFEFDIPKMDVYAGAGFAVNIDKEPYYTYSWNYGFTNRVRFSHYAFAGIRYYFTDLFGVFAEVGHGHRAVTGGMVFAF